MDVNQETDDQMQQLWDAELAGDTTPPAESIQPVVEQQLENQETAEVPEATQAPEDPFAGLPEAVKARLAQIDQVVAANEQLAQDLRTAAGRVSYLQREFDLAKRAQQQTGGQAPSNAQIAAAGNNSEKWDRLKKEFPDWADGLQELVAMSLSQTQAQPSIDPQAIAQLVNARVGEVQASMAQQIEMAKIETKHENWVEEINTPEFAAWMKLQPPEVQKLAESDRARDAIRMLDLYQTTKTGKKADAIKQERGARLAVAATQKGNSAPAPKSIEDMSEAELWEYEARQLEKRSRA